MRVSIRAIWLTLLVAGCVGGAPWVPAASGSGPMLPPVLSGRPPVSLLGNPRTGVPADMQLWSTQASPAPPVTLTIKTVPALDGIRFTIDGSNIVTDAAGTASVTNPHNSEQHVLTLVDTIRQTGDEKYTFARWVGQRDPDAAFGPTLRDISMRTNVSLTVAFAEQRLVTAGFRDEHGKPIETKQITSATVRSDVGVLVDIPAAGSVWLDGTRVSYRDETLSTDKITYSWQSVIVAGTNVIDAGRQTFTPATDSAVNVVGQFHTLTVTGNDALFGTGAGRSASITFPDGAVQTVDMDGQHSAVFHDLPRGVYQVNVAAGASIVASQQVRLSKDVLIDLPVIGIGDLIVVAAALAVIAVGLILAGRRGLRSRLAGILQRIRPRMVPIS
jgi:hypothetical protein